MNEEKSLSEMEEHFIKWYEIIEKKSKLHRFFFPKCKRCKLNDDLYKKLKEKKQNGTRSNNK